MSVRSSAVAVPLAAQFVVLLRSAFSSGFAVPSAAEFGVGDSPGA